jgi:myo-inositol-1(or 4)-monophosphatase
MDSSHRRGIDVRQADLGRLSEALAAAAEILRSLSGQNLKVDFKANDDPVTEVDRAVNEKLLEMLPREGEGWLSEETADDSNRLKKRRVWVVDPLDGTREFVAGIPEWCVSIGLVEEGRPVAGGMLNPATGELFLGSRETGVQVNGKPRHQRECPRLSEAVVLASRTEVGRGHWDRYRSASFSVTPVGSVAYKLALVAAGRADATWTLAPKHEWDVAAGVALVEAAGGFVAALDGQTLRFNQPKPWLDGLMAFSAEAKKVFAPLDQWL